MRGKLHHVKYLYIFYKGISPLNSYSYIERLIKMSLNSVQALTVTTENDGTGANAKTARKFLRQKCDYSKL